MKKKSDFAVSRALLERRCKVDSLILANLTHEEFTRFHKAKILYSGSTGPCVPGLYRSKRAPYIATFFFCLRRALRALRWKHASVSVTRAGGQWVARKKKS